MAWIESHDELPTHRKTRRAARLLEVEVPHVIGHLHCLWYWCLTHAPDGRLDGMDALDLADAAMWTGDPERFAKALLDAGWLDDDGGCWQVHDWWDGAGKTIKRRRHANERQRRARQAGDNAAGHGDDERDDEDGHADVTRDTGVSHATVTPPTGTETGGEDPNGSSRPDSPDPDVSDDARTLTRELALAIKANGHKLPREGTQAHRAWLVEMDRLLRIGAPGGDPEPTPVDEVRRVMRFATSDEFWRANVLSAPKFREKFTQLRAQCDRARDSPPTSQPDRHDDSDWD